MLGPIITTPVITPNNPITDAAVDQIDQAIGDDGYQFGEITGAIWNNITGATQLNSFNKTEAQKQRDFEERMDNTKYQRAVEDMKAAGLNPATLSAGSMNVTAAPSGYAASSVGRGSPITDLAKLVTSIGSLINGKSSKK